VSYKKFSFTRSKLLNDANASIDNFLDKYQNTMSILKKIKNVSVNNTNRLAKIMKLVDNEE